MNMVPQTFNIPKVTTNITATDFIGAVRVRMGIKRDNFRVDPGIYAIGDPTPDSDVLVTANYKLSFDTLRKNLAGISCWILVLDTMGVNVWCAAGKGTFGTRELVNRIRVVSLDKIVTHKRIILPQLGATGVAAHKVREETGFNVHYGPVRASDVKQFIANGYRADKEMRRVTFGFTDRAKLIPVDFFGGKYYLFGAIMFLLLVSGLGRNVFTFASIAENAGLVILNVFMGYFAGVVITPVFLPYIPGRYFSLKGIFSGTLVYLCISPLIFHELNLIESISWLFIITGISSFMAMNFTGSSTFTSLSGVKKEMKLFIPFQIGFAIAGIVLQVGGKLFIKY